MRAGEDTVERTAPPAPPILGDNRPSDLPTAVEKAKESIKKIPEKVNNQKEFADASNKAKDDVAEVRKKLNPEAEKTWNKDVMGPVADQIKAAREVQKNPQDKAAKKGLDDATDKVLKALDDVVDKNDPTKRKSDHEEKKDDKQKPPPPPGSLKEAVERAIKAANAVPTTVKSNPKNTPNATDDVQKSMDDVRDKIITPNPDKAFDWQKDVQKPIDDLLRASDRAASNPSDSAAQKALENASNDAVKALENLEKELPQKKDASSIPDDGVAETPQQAAAQAKSIAKGLPTVAKQQGPDAQQRANNNLARAVDNLKDQLAPSKPLNPKKQVEEPVNKVIDAADKAMKNPNDPNAERALADAVQDALKALDQVARLGSPGNDNEPNRGPSHGSPSQGAPSNQNNNNPGASRGKSPGKDVENAGNEVSNALKNNPNRVPKALDDLKNKVEDAKRTFPRGAKKDWPQNVDDNLEDLLRKAREGLKKPGDKQAQKDVDDALKKLLDGLKKVAQNDPAPLADALARAKDNIQKIPSTLQSSNPENANKVASSAQDDVAEAGANATLDQQPTWNDKVQRPVDELAKAVAAAAKAPHDNALKANVDKAVQKAIKAIDDAARNDPRGVNLNDQSAGPNGSDDFPSKLEDLKRALNDLPGQVESNPDADSVNAANDEVQNKADDAKKNAPVEARRVWPERAQQPINDALNAAKEVASNPSDPNLKRKLQDAVDDAVNALDNLQNDSANNPDALFSPDVNSRGATGKQSGQPSALDEARKQIDDLPERLRKNPHHGEKALDDLKDALNNAKRNFSPGARKEWPNTVEPNLEDLLRKAREALKKPKDKDLEQQVEDAAKELKKAFNNAAENDPAAFEDAIARAIDGCNALPAIVDANPSLVDDAVGGVQNDVDDARDNASPSALPQWDKSVQEPLDNLYKAAADAANNKNEPQSKAALKDALEKAVNALQNAAAKDPRGVNPHNASAGGVKGTDSYPDAVNAAKKALNDLPAAAKNGPDAASDAITNAEDKVDDAKNQAPLNVRRDWPENVQGPVDKALNAAARAAENPSDSAAQKALADAVKDAVKALDNELKPERKNSLPVGKSSSSSPSSASSSPQSASDAAKAASPDLDRAIEKAKADARSLADAAKTNPDSVDPASNNFNNSVDDVKPLAPLAAQQTWPSNVQKAVDDLVNAADEAKNNPQDPSKRAAVAPAFNQALKALDSIKKPTLDRGTSSYKPEGYNPAGGDKGPSHGKGNYTGPKYDASAGDKGPSHGKGNYQGSGSRPEADKAKDAVKEIQNAAKSKDPAKFERAKKDLKDAAAETQKALKPGAKLPVDWNNDIQGPVDNQKKAAQVASQKPTDQKAAQDLDKATQDLVNSLNSLCGPRGTDGKPGPTKLADVKKDVTPDEKKKLAQQMKNMAEPLAQAVAKTPQGRERMAQEQMKDSVSQFKRALQRGKPKEAVLGVKQVAANAQHLSQALRDSANDPSQPEAVRLRKQQQANDIDNALKPFVEKAQNAISKPKDAQAQQELKDATKKLDRAIKRNQPKKQEDSALGKEGQADHLARIRDAIAKAKANKGDKIGASLDEPMKQNFRILKKREGRAVDPDGLTGPSEELKNLWKKFRTDADAGNAKGMEDSVPEIEKAMKKIDAATNATPLAAADRIEREAENIMAAVDNNNPARLKEAAANIKEALADLSKEANASQDPDVRKAGQKAVNEATPKVKDLLEKAVTAMNNPKDRTKAQAVENSLERLKKPLAEFKADASPQGDEALENEKNAAQVKEKLANLRDALAAKEPSKVAAAKKEAKEALQEYVQKAKDVAKDQDNESKQNQLDRKVDGLDDLLACLDDLNPSSDMGKLEDFADNTFALLDDFDDILHNDDTDDAVKAAAKSSNISASLQLASDEDMDLGDLLSAAMDMSDLLRGMADNTLSVANNLGVSQEDLESASAGALDLDDILAGLDGSLNLDDSPSSAPQQPASKPVPKQVASLQVPQSSSRRSSTSAGGLFENVVPLDRAKSFEDVAHSVAYNIHNRTKEVKSEAASGIAKELATLSTVSRQGKKSEMMVSSKNAATQLLSFVKELTDLANKIPGKTRLEQEKKESLLRTAAGLRNYSTHLKILTSVKAASVGSGEASETDTTLTVLCTDLGNIITNALSEMQTVNQILKL
eukprot:TRINITY_DN51_c0_g1_i1.p1 TRINITY_DN51_c0_g1~~TRINITY_DN51_c0_g1_i1.p1  ORF type:complete len:2407 (-),score=1023.65 TRINITY_DN51_c0_g1_i1:86-6571(-)